MKRQAVADAWRRVGVGWGESRLVESVSTSSFSGFHDDVSEIFGGLTVICGQNGSGKTRLLTAIAEAVTASTDEPVTVSCGEVDRSKVAYLDLSWQIQRQLRSIVADASLDERVEQAGAVSLKAVELRLLQFVLSDELEAIEIYELDSTDEPVIEPVPHPAIRLSQEFREDAIPYFVLTAGGDKRATPELSRGELSVLTLFWALRQMDVGGVLLVDEPDAYLSPQAARRAFDMVAHFVGTTKFHCVASSHSYLALSTLPSEHLLILERDVNRVTTISPATSASLWRTLRIAPVVQIVFAVEDAAGAQWLRTLFRLTDFEHADVSAIWIVAGDSGVRKFAELPAVKEGGGLRFWGVLDGDQRDSNANKGNFLLLPGAKSPEQMALDILAKGDASVLGEDIAPPRVLEVLSRHKGEDAHDKLLALANEFGFQMSTLRDRLLTDWLLKSDEGSVALVEFREGLQSVTGPAAS